MALYLHELRRARVRTIVFSLLIAFLIFACVLIYPQMESQIDSMNEMMSGMGAFSDAFQLENVNFSTLIGYYGMESENTLCLIGGFLAALIGILALCGEEKNHTAEFLLSHPLGRCRVVLDKYLAVLTQLFVFNAVVMGAGALGFVLVGEKIPQKAFLMLHLAYFLLQVVVATICFALSAILRRGGIGIGLGLCAVFYFFQMIANLTQDAKVLHYFTPFSFAASAEIVTKQRIDPVYLSIGLITAAVCLIFTFAYYRQKDIIA